MMVLVSYALWCLLHYSVWILKWKTQKPVKLEIQNFLCSIFRFLPHYPKYPSSFPTLFLKKLFRRHAY